MQHIQMTVQESQSLPIKVLLFEDDAYFVNLIRSRLQQPSPTVSHAVQVELVHTNQLATGLAYLQTLRIDIILLNLELPDCQGINTLNKIITAVPHIPIIILCDNDNQQTALDAVQQGAQDYLLKNNLDIDILTRSLHYAIKNKQLQLDLAQSADALESSEAKRRQSIETNDDGIIVLDEQGNIRLVNATTVQILGRSQDELKGEKIHLTPAQAIADYQQTKEKLAQKAKQLEARNIELDAFAHTTAHQIQGLLSQMIGYASYLEMHYDSMAVEEGQDILHRILRSGHKMSNVLSELLLLAYVDTDDIPLTPLDMNRIINETQKRMAFEIEEHQGELKIPTTWPTVLGYGSWIEEVWINYISNALKYGGNPPQIELGWNNEGDDSVRFWVKDNGVGIDSAAQRQLFKPHTRLRQVQVKGEGLGLSIVHRIIKRCQGEVGVISAVNEGSMFWFTLPCAKTPLGTEFK